MDNKIVPHPLMSEFYGEMDYNIEQFPNDLFVFIPTYGREGLQTTIKYFPEETWGVNVFLVAPENEDHGKYPVVNSPSEIDTISKKRQWIMEYARDKGYKKVVIADDNMRIRYRKYDKPEICTLIDSKDKGVIYSAWQFLSNRLEDYHVAQCRNGFFAQKSSQIHLTGSGGNSLYGIRVDTYFELGIDTSPLPIYEDMHVLLEFVKSGYHFLLYCDIVADKKFMDKGGNRNVASYSKSKEYDKALLDFIDLHPEFTELKTLKTGHENRPTNNCVRFKFNEMRKHIERLNEPPTPTVFDLV